MAVLLLADVNDGTLATDSVAKTIAAVKGLGDVHLLVAGKAGKAAAAEAARRDPVQAQQEHPERGHGGQPPGRPALERAVAVHQARPDHGGSLVALDRGAAAIASRPTEKRRIVLDVIHDDHAAMCADVAARLRTPVVGASVEEVCERAGYTRGAFYSNFATKDELLVALLDREEGLLLERLSTALGASLSEPAPLTAIAGLPPVDDSASMFVPVVVDSIITPTTVLATVKSSSTPSVWMVVVQIRVSPWVTVIGIVAGIISMLVAIV